MTAPLRVEGQTVDTRPFAERNKRHEFTLPLVVDRLAHVGIDAELSGAEQLGWQLNQQVRAAGGAEWRYWPDLKCTVRSTGLVFWLEVKTGYRESTQRCSVEWDAYLAQLELAKSGMRIVWLFDHGYACWITDLEFCSPVWEGVQPGRTAYRLVDGHGAFLRPLEQLLDEEFECSPTTC
jgi:hypothetical protein